MFDMARHVEIKRLLEQLAEVEDKLLPNELEMVHSLAAKYDEPGHGDFDDVTCLEVILRNVEVRKGFKFDTKRDAGRVIDMPRKKS